MFQAQTEKVKGLTAPNHSVVSNQSKHPAIEQPAMTRAAKKQASDQTLERQLPAVSDIPASHLGSVQAGYYRSNAVSQGVCAGVSGLSLAILCADQTHRAGSVTTKDLADQVQDFTRSRETQPKLQFTFPEQLVLKNGETLPANHPRALAETAEQVQIAVNEKGQHLTTANGLARSELFRTSAELKQYLSEHNNIAALYAYGPNPKELTKALAEKASPEQLAALPKSGHQLLVKADQNGKLSVLDPASKNNSWVPLTELGESKNYGLILSYTFPNSRGEPRTACWQTAPLSKFNQAADAAVEASKPSH